jgi:hypothetical protein
VAKVCAGVELRDHLIDVLVGVFFKAQSFRMAENYIKSGSFVPGVQYNTVLYIFVSSHETASFTFYKLVTYVTM